MARKRSPDKHAGRWTKHTSYPTAGSEKTRIPSELNTAARVNNKLAEQELDASRSRINSIQRKSIHLLDSQKKLLEKSMLAYSEKMKEISNSKTNELFREIHTRNASRNDLRVKSPTSTSVSGRSNFSLPARLPPALHVKHRPSYCDSLKGFKQVNIPTPIPEASSRGSTAEIRQVVSNTSSPASGNGKRTTIIVRKSASVRNASRVKKTQSVDGDNMSTNSIPTYTTQTYHKGIPRVLINSLPWMKDADGSGSDSAYSSASEDLDTDGLSPRDLKNQSDNEENIDPQSQYVFTIPKIHVRKRTKKSHSIGQLKTNDDLHRQVVLNQARASASW